MKKIFSFVALLAALLFATSGYNEYDRVLAVGDDVPSLAVSNNDTAFNLRESKGDYVLLTFWTTSDARSRVDCQKYSKWFEKNDPLNVKHISVNFDEEPALFREIVRLDNLDHHAQFNVNGSEASQIRHDFGLDNGYGSILIDPNGYIKSFNPSSTDLRSLL